MSRYLSRIRTEPIYYKVRNDFQSLVDNIPAIGKSARKVFHKVKGSLKYLLLPGVLFEELGFHYYGPLDGHNIAEMYRVFRRVKDIKEPVLIHVCTKKGRGYSPAEEKPQKYHGISPFDVETGEVKKRRTAAFPTFSARRLPNLLKNMRISQQ